ncbi:hypothetical protein JTB14_009218 [Gonioctena quinquepunctata]|nr:hypothetical protein JTB14_009218 [Gonioctena quinquepunctata]
MKNASDSQAVSKALSSCRSTSELVWNYTERFNNLSLAWIHGHSGLEGNEAADFLAKEGAAKDSIGPEPVLGISSSFAKLSLNTWTARKVSDFWHNLPGLVQSEPFINPAKNVTSQLFDSSRDNLHCQ